jgi:CRISPR system Cascade subunit CasE
VSVYLTRLTFDLRSPGVRRDLADIHELHRTVMRQFDPDKGNRAPQRVLYRLEFPPGTAPSLLIQSGEQPALQLEEGYLLRPPENKDISAALDAITARQLLRFRLRANPTRRPPTTDRPNAPRIPITGWDDRLSWLRRKLENAGGPPVEGTVDIATRPHDTGRANGHRITIWPVLYQGLLQVENPHHLRTAIISGIGPARAYGNGLLSVAPAAATRNSAPPVLRLQPGP